MIYLYIILHGDQNQNITLGKMTHSTVPDSKSACSLLLLLITI